MAVLRGVVHLSLCAFSLQEKVMAEDRGNYEELLVMDDKRLEEKWLTGDHVDIPHLTVFDEHALEEKFPLWWLSLKKMKTASVTNSAKTLPPGGKLGSWECELDELGKENTHKHLGDWPVRCRRNLPTFSRGTTGRFLYMEIPQGSTKLAQVQMSLLQRYHSAIMLWTTDFRGEHQFFTFETIPRNVSSAMFPEDVHEENGPKWGSASENMVVYSKDKKHMHRRWMLNKLAKRTEFARIHHSDTLNKLMDVVTDMATGAAKRPVWQVFQLWKSSEPNMQELQHNFDAQPDSFSQSLVWAVMEAAGSSHNPEMIRLQRNYISVISNSEPEFKAPNDPEVIAFYKTWLLIKKTTVPMTALFRHLKRTMAKGLPIFIYDQLRNQYVKVSKAEGLRMKYAFMPLPRTYFDRCKKDLGDCSHWGDCNRTKGSRCVNYRCTCPQDMCMFKGTFGQTKGHADTFCSV